MEIPTYLVRKEQTSLALFIEGMLGNHNGTKQENYFPALLIFGLFSCIFPHLPSTLKSEPQAWFIWKGNSGLQFIWMTSNQGSWGCMGGKEEES